MVRRVCPLPALSAPRAIELKHNPSLISALANETSKMYTVAADALGTLDQKVFGHWRIYFALKSKFYSAYVSRTPLRTDWNVILPS